MKIKKPSDPNFYYVFLAGGLLILFFVIVIFSLRWDYFSNPRPDNFPTTDQNHSDNEPPKGLERAQLESKTPYQGENFSIILNDELGQFVVNFNPSNKTAGLNEFRQFLSDNGLTLQDLEGYYTTTEIPF